MIKNELVSAAVMSLVVAVLVWWNSPKEDGRSWATFLKAYAIAFVITFTIFYFISDSGTDEVIDNMIKGAPDF